MSTNYGFEPTLDGLNNIDADSSTATNIICDTIQINTSGTAPTRAPADNSTNIATTSYVDNATTGVFVDLTTTQTITGEKTFSNANTLITGNLVVNSIRSASATTDINIGQNLTTGDIFMGTSVSTGVALNWGSSSNGGNLTFRGGTFNFFGSGLIYLRGGPTFDINVGDTQTSGILNIGTGTSRTGAVNIATGATATSTAISIGNQTGAFGSVDIGTTTITVGKANTATNNMQTSTNGTLNLKTTSTGGAVNLGTGMTSGNIIVGGASSSSTNILIGSSQTTYTGAISIGTVVTGNAPITIGSSASTTQTATHNALTTFSKIPSCVIAPTTGNDLCNKTYVDSVSSSLLATNNVWTGTNAFNTSLPTSTLTPSSNTQLTTKVYVDDADTIVFGLCAKIGSNNTFTGTTNRFEGLNGVRSGSSTNYASLTQNGGQSILNAFGSSTNVLYLQTNGSSNMTFGESGGIKYGINSGDFYNTTGDMFINQSTYPPSNTSALGYNVTTTAAEFTFTADTLGTIASFTVPSKGVWSCNISVKYRTTGGAGSFENVQLFLTDSASGTTAYRTFEYFDETDVTVGSNGKRFVHTISGTLTTTASTTFYIRGINDTTGITTLAEPTYSYTRVG